ncbi:hypothetical protein F5146DRAFT_1130454 [Armillaria mellea]|nr:hypothetical protein F5146DRAFT_1130454 [Armillaria mellea]
MNVYRLPATLSNIDNALFLNLNTFSGDTANTPFTQVPMPVPSINNAPSSFYGDVMIFTPTPQPVIQMAITHTDAHSHSGVENFYSTQHQDNVNSQDSRVRFLEDYLIVGYIAVHGWRHGLASSDRY